MAPREMPQGGRAACRALDAGTSVASRRDHRLGAFMLGTDAYLSSALALDAADIDRDGAPRRVGELAPARAGFRRA